jgi:glycosyltransferase involved in cell wall biosynthesis
MAAGLAVITTAHATIAETVRAGSEAVFVENRSPAQLARAIDELVQAPARRAQLGLNARQRFLSRYTYAQWTRDVLRAFATAFEQASSTPVVLASVAQPVRKGAA